MSTHKPHLTNGQAFTIEKGHHAQIRKTTRSLGVFFMIYVHALRKAREQIGEALPTLVEIMSRVTSDNQVYFRVAKLAEDMHTTNQRINRHVKILRTAGLIEPDPEDKDVRFVKLWRICPFLSWRGTKDALLDYLGTLPEDHIWFEYQEPTRDL